ncbi:MAG: hypothetical protein EOO41_03055, partial [Methanobacteriota archaeon]
MDVFGGSEAGGGAAAAAAGATGVTSASALASPHAVALAVGVTFKPASLPEAHPCRELLLAATASVAPLLPASSAQTRAQLQTVAIASAATKEGADAAPRHVPTIA